MSAVTLPLQQTHGNVTLYPVPGSPLRLYSIAFTFLGLAALGVLHLALKRRYKLTCHACLNVIDPSATACKRPLNTDKSRGASVYSKTMSVNQPSGISQLRVAEKLSDGGKTRDQNESKEEDTSGSLRGKTTSPMNTDTGMPLILTYGPPPPLPLTPPTLSIDVYSFQDRRLSVAASSMGDLDANFFQQPNPDYTLSPSSELASTALPHSDGSSSIPRRRSYAKLLPLGPTQPNTGNDTASFSPSSFPSSSPILPLAPHESLESREIDVKGEIISVMDDSGAGWKRHTRVYGGGVCLACLASGAQEGIYGDNVPPEHRR
ncbi:hypothetical protein GGR54DRAFT_192116 [Hypoxylon sp. NC1633]|nr:hypothetical protein GGR54DRAFT_192116 [Hypoxylon sp. NC1633]